MTRIHALVFTVALVTTVDAAAQFLPAQARPAQPRPAQRPQPAAPRATTSVRAFGDVGYTTFTAADSFEMTLGSPAAMVFGGGAEVVLPQKIFIGVRFSRFQANGSRVFVFNGQRFDLGIPMTVKVTPILVSAGLRFGTPRSTLLPYIGGGIGWHSYEETSDFAVAGEDVSERHQGYHVLGGAEYRVSRLIGVAGEAQWATVPGALGQNPMSVSAALDETDLGGFTVRIKLVIGR